VLGEVVEFELHLGRGVWQLRTKSRLTAYTKSARAVCVGQESIDYRHRDVGPAGAQLRAPSHPGYYYVLFEDPDGIRLEVCFVPGTDLLAPGTSFNPSGELSRRLSLRRAAAETVNRRDVRGGRYRGLSPDVAGRPPLRRCRKGGASLPGSARVGEGCRVYAAPAW
jgi:hypothetical protein